MCCAVLMHVTYLVKTTSHDSAPPPLLLYKPEPHIAVDIPRGLPSPLPCPCPCLTNPAFPQISPDFNPNLEELTDDQFWSFKKRLRTESRHHLCAVEMRRTIKRGGPRPFDWIHRFPWLPELGTLILFVHLHWDSARFMLMNAPDSTIWPLQGNSGEHNGGPIPTPHLSAIRKREIEYWIFCRKGSTLKTFSGNDLSHFHWLVCVRIHASIALVQINWEKMKTLEMYATLSVR